MPITQYILQTVSALIFNEWEQDYQLVTMLLDSGAQRSFINAQVSSNLKLPIIGSTLLTTTGMRELIEIFQSNRVPITLKGIYNSKKLQRQPIHTEEKLIAETRTAQLPDEDRRFIKDRKVTLGQRNLKSSVLSPDLLIGQDLLSNIIDHSAPTLKLPSGLILTLTIFGYNISGTSEVDLVNNDINSTRSSLIVATPFVTIAKDECKMDTRMESLGSHPLVQKEAYDSVFDDNYVTGTHQAYQTNNLVDDIDVGCKSSTTPSTYIKHAPQPNLKQNDGSSLHKISVLEGLDTI